VMAVPSGGCHLVVETYLVVLFCSLGLLQCSNHRWVVLIIVLGVILVLDHVHDCYVVVAAASCCVFKDISVAFL
jgi:hypothetical protein